MAHTKLCDTQFLMGCKEEVVGWLDGKQARHDVHGAGFTRLQHSRYFVKSWSSDLLHTNLLIFLKHVKCRCLPSPPPPGIFSHSGSGWGSGTFSRNLHKGALGPSRRRTSAWPPTRPLEPWAWEVNAFPPPPGLVHPLPCVSVCMSLSPPGATRPSVGGAALFAPWRTEANLWSVQPGGFSWWQEGGRVVPAAPDQPTHARGVESSHVPCRGRG